MSSISESLNMLADAIRSLNPYENPTVKIQEPKVGMQVGTCLNCRRAVVLRQPWLSKMPVVNDGWNLPKEIVEAIDLRVQLAYKDAYRQICQEYNRHKGAWITADVARKYAAKSWIWRVLADGQYIGKVREIGEELQKEYGVTELEAINILNEHNVDDYLNKYYRIQHRIPVYVNAQAICADMAYEYLEMAM